MLKIVSITVARWLSSLPGESWIKQIPVLAWIGWTAVQHDVLAVHEFHLATWIGKACLLVHPKLRWLLHSSPVGAAENQEQVDHRMKLNELNEFGETEVKVM